MMATTGGLGCVGTFDTGRSGVSGVERALVFEALADGCRRHLLDRLRSGNGRTLSDLCHGLDITRQAVTKHLKVLEAADLVVVRRRGRERLHFLNPVPLHATAMRWLHLFDGVMLDALAAPDETKPPDRAEV